MADQAVGGQAEVTGGSEPDQISDPGPDQTSDSGPDQTRGPEPDQTSDPEPDQTRGPGLGGTWDPEPSDAWGSEAIDRRGGIRAVTLIRLLLVGVLFFVAVVVVGFVVAPGQATPGDNSVAAGLARDMTDHHAQAVDMATIIQGRTHDPAIRFLATDIALTQANQMGQMQGWLNDWNLSIGRSGAPMQWMKPARDGMSMGAGGSPVVPVSMMVLQPDGLMPGMATQAQVNQLRTLPVQQADVLFLRLMISHHRGGVTMAQVALAETKERVVVNLCRTIVTSQNAEIVQMSQLLKERT